MRFLRALLFTAVLFPLRYRYLVNKDLLHYEIDLSGKKLRMEQSEEAVRSKNVKVGCCCCIFRLF